MMVSISMPYRITDALITLSVDCSYTSYSCHTLFHTISVHCSYTCYTLSTVRVWFEPSVYTVDESSGRVILMVRTNVPGGPSDGELEFYTLDGTAVCKSMCKL